MDSAFDEVGRWIGPCEVCGTNHDGLPPGTVGGDLLCLRAQFEALGATHLVDQIDAGMSHLALRRDDGLRALGIIP